MPEFDPALDRDRSRIFGIHDLRLLVQDREDLLRRREGGLQRTKLLCELLDRLEKGADIVDEHKQRSQRDCPRQHGRAALPDHDDHRKDGKHVDRRAENGKGHDLAPVCPEKLLALIFKFLIFLPLPRKDLDQFHARNMFGQKRIQLRDARPCQTVRLSGHIAEKERQPCHKRNQQKRIQRHAHIDREHHDRKADDLHRVFEKLCQYLRKQLVDRLRVVGHPRHELADRLRVKKVDGECVNVRKDLLAHPVDDGLPDILQDPCVGGVEHKAQQEHQGVQSPRAQDPAESLLHPEIHARLPVTADVIVDGISDDDRLVELHTDQRDDKH